MRRTIRETLQSTENDQLYMARVCASRPPEPWGVSLRVICVMVLPWKVGNYLGNQVMRIWIGYNRSLGRGIPSPLDYSRHRGLKLEES